ncbi:MAG: UTP--glucose-1-phosphate uridylyltransferase [Sulfurimonas sp.]|nr:UTP--glucose-1-phosphate uridylyltransferase [Sulfurimonas sp.]MDD3836121.1 UTP--glucose-1-phosphate uridylyltransferase [Sulfurimonas sp.]
MSDIRLDTINNKYVIIAPERLHRPNLQSYSREKSSKVNCPFCEGNEHMTPNEVYALRYNEPNKGMWKTRVVPNLYKAVQVELEDKSQRDGVFEFKSGVGAHEILIDSPCHDCDINDLSVFDVENWLRTMILRIEDLKDDKRLIHLSIFKNFGQNAGATQDHPHTQLLALPIMPKKQLAFLNRNIEYYFRHGRGKIEDIVHNEIKAKKRVLYIVGNFVSFCPYASEYPFEVMIAPTKNISSLNRCSREDLIDLANIIKMTFKKLNKQLGVFDYNLFFDLAPLNLNFETEKYMPYIDKNYRFTIKITPRIYRSGGFEISTGMFINSVEPEYCARLLRGD